MRQTQSRRSRVRDWLLYVAIAVLIVGLAVAYGAYQGLTGRHTDLPLKWLGFIAISALLFGYAIKASRRFWRTRKFWVILALFFVVHAGLGVFALTRVDKVPLILYPILGQIEYVLLALYLGYFLDSN